MRRLYKRLMNNAMFYKDMTQWLHGRVFWALAAGLMLNLLCKLTRELDGPTFKLYRMSGLRKPELANGILLSGYAQCLFGLCVIAPFACFAGSSNTWRFSCSRGLSLAGWRR